MLHYVYFTVKICIFFISIFLTSLNYSVLTCGRTVHLQVTKEIFEGCWFFACRNLLTMPKLERHIALKVKHCSCIYERHSKCNTFMIFCTTVASLRFGYAMNGDCGNISLCDVVCSCSTILLTALLDSFMIITSIRSRCLLGSHFHFHVGKKALLLVDL